MVSPASRNPRVCQFLHLLNLSFSNLRHLGKELTVATVFYILVWGLECAIGQQRPKRVPLIPRPQQDLKPGRHPQGDTKGEARSPGLGHGYMHGGFPELQVGRGHRGQGSPHRGSTGPPALLTTSEGAVLSSCPSPQPCLSPTHQMRFRDTDVKYRVGGK